MSKRNARNSWVLIKHIFYVTKCKLFDEMNTKQTETDFINALKSVNPNISETEIQEKISDYELTKSFYTPDSNQFSNTFSTIKEMGMTVSNYVYNRSKYWISNYDEVVGAEKDNKIFTSQNKYILVVDL